MLINITHPLTSVYETNKIKMTN